MDQRQFDLKKWVSEELKLPRVILKMVSGDASFRRYFRVDTSEGNWIAMDAPPEKEESSGFVAISKNWLSQGVPTPEIKAVDLAHGFMLLSDMGNIQLIDELFKTTSGQPDAEQGDRYYAQAMSILIDIQSLKPNTANILPPYNSELLQREMALFRDWLLEEKLELTLSEDECKLLDDSFILLERQALSQKQVTVHRDYHSRNLMVLNDDSLGVLDFQDAVIGPVSYDLVSLLRDCYVVWPDEKVTQWCQYFHSLLVSQNMIDVDYLQFKQDFDLMGIQRHLKAAGIFARLSLRDGKHAYLDDIPRTVNYIIQVTRDYPQLTAFHAFLLNRVQPALVRMSTLNQVVNDK